MFKKNIVILHRRKCVASAKTEIERKLEKGDVTIRISDITWPQVDILDFREFLRNSGGFFEFEFNAPSELAYYIVADSYEANPKKDEVDEEASKSEN